MQGHDAVADKVKCVCNIFGIRSERGGFEVSGLGANGDGAVRRAKAE
jgi:hypothetical protein